MRCRGEKMNTGGEEFEKMEVEKKKKIGGETSAIRIGRRPDASIIKGEEVLDEVGGKIRKKKAKKIKIKE